MTTTPNFPTLHPAADDPRARKCAEAVGATIRLHRGLRGMVQLTLARKLGWTLDRIQRIEAGIHPLTASELIAICRALQERPETLLDRACIRYAAKAGNTFRPFASCTINQVGSVLREVRRANSVSLHTIMARVVE